MNWRPWIELAATFVLLPIVGLAFLALWIVVLRVVLAL